MAKSEVKAKAKSIVKAKKPVKAKTIKVCKLPKTELLKYKTLLIKKREQVGGDLSHIAGNTLNKSAREASGDLSGYSFHMADQATDDYDRDFSLERATAEQKELYFIDEALKRISDGTYGSCLSCSGPIAKKRLTAMPHSEYCIECQTKTEHK